MKYKVYIQEGSKKFYLGEMTEEELKNYASNLKSYQRSFIKVQRIDEKKENYYNKLFDDEER